MANACPGIKVDNFTYFNNFILLIRIQPSPIQLEQDEPLLITVENVLPDDNNYTYDGKKLKEHSTITSISQLDDIVKELTEKFEIICLSFCDKIDLINERLTNIEAKDES